MRSRERDDRQVSLKRRERQPLLQLEELPAFSEVAQKLQEDESLPSDPVTLRELVGLLAGSIGLSEAELRRLHLAAVQHHVIEHGVVMVSRTTSRVSYTLGQAMAFAALGRAVSERRISAGEGAALTMTPTAEDVSRGQELLEDYPTYRAYLSEPARGKAETKKESADGASQTADREDQQTAADYGENTDGEPYWYENRPDLPYPFWKKLPRLTTSQRENLADENSDSLVRHIQRVSQASPYDSASGMRAPVGAMLAAVFIQAVGRQGWEELEEIVKRNIDDFTNREIILAFKTGVIALERYNLDNLLELHDLAVTRCRLHEAEAVEEKISAAPGGE